MIDRTPQCPSCGSFHVQEVIYGYPSPIEIAKSEMGTAVLAGPRPFADMPTRRCGDCTSWWQDNDLPPGEYPIPLGCHFCGDPLSFQDQNEFDEDVKEYWRRRDDEQIEATRKTFAYHPLPVCRCCRSAIQDLQSEIETEERLHNEAARRLRLLFLTLLAMGLIGLITIAVSETFLGSR